MTKHKHYEACYRAHLNTSHVPETRAKSWCEQFDLDAASVIEAGGSAEKHEKLFLAWMSAKARCISAMITGPSNFPIRRQEKANRGEELHSKAYYAYMDAVAKAHHKAAHPEKYAISSDEPDALEKLRAKWASRKEFQEKMVAFNKAMRKGDRAAMAAAVGEDRVDSLLKPNCFNRKGFEPFQMSNNLAEIKRLEARISQLEKIGKLEAKEIDHTSHREVHNTADNRVQLFFKHKPVEDTRKQLKYHGFRWAPSVGAWQRQLNANGLHAAKRITEYFNNCREA